MCPSGQDFDPNIRLFQITNPRDTMPPFTYGTVMSGNTEDTLRKNYRALYNYMAKDNKFFKENVTAGVAAVKMG